MDKRYTEHLKEIADRLGGIDERITTIDKRITSECGAIGDEIAALRKVVNEEQAQQNTRLGGVEKYVALRSSIERGAIWVTGITVSVAGLVLGLLKALD